MTARFLLVLPLTIALAACGGGSRPAGFSATLPPPPVQDYAAPQHADGAIFSPTQGYAPLYNGTRAAQVGDLVTIVLIERTTTSKAARSKHLTMAGVDLPEFCG